MTFPMAEDEYYTQNIDPFVERHGLVKSGDLTTGVDWSDGPVELLYRFPDGRAALGFQEIVPNYLFKNTYLGPDIEDAWMEEVAAF